MIPVCCYCGSDIETSNVAHPGYCSPPCRDYDTRERADVRRRERTRRQKLGVQQLARELNRD